MTLCRSLLTVVLLPLAVYPQAQSNAGSLKGSVLDQSGSGISKAKLTISEPDRGISRTADSTNDGSYFFALVPPGRYQLRVEASGFTTKVLEGVDVRVGDTLSLLIQMVVGGVQQQIEVQADVPVVEGERVQQANTIELARIRNLPINRRNYLDFALLSPATSDTSTMVDGTDYRVAQTPQSGISFGGGNGRGNGFFIDGVENYINSGGVRPSVSQEAVQEFQINRNTASAEFGWAAGGTVNIVTRGGSNELHGNVFGFLRHRSIQARNFFDPQKSGFTRVQAGATLGGALRKDHTFYFLSYERLDRQETAFVPILQDRSAFNAPTGPQQNLLAALNASGSPTLIGLSRALSAALTPSTNAYVTRLFQNNSGTFPFSEGDNTVSARLDHRFSDRHSFYLRGNLSTLRNQNDQFGALVAYNRGRNFELWDGTTMLSDIFVLNNNWVVETRAMFNFSTVFVTPTDGTGPEQNVTGFGYFGREIFLPSRTYERHYQIIQNWNRHSGSHDLKFGVDINPVRDTADTETFFSGRFSFGEAIPLSNVIAGAAGSTAVVQQISQFLQAAGQGSLVPVLGQPVSALQSMALGLPTFYQQGFGNPNWIGWSKRYGFYVQDSWRIRPNLTLSAGLRYDLEVNEKVLGTDRNNFAPRVGFAWSPAGSRDFVIRGGYGIYYTPTNLQVANVADALSGRSINQVFVPITGIPQIVNPQTGRPTTSADIYQSMLRQGILGTRTITPADLLPLGIRVGPGLPLRVEFGSDALRQGYAQQGSFELERALGGWAVSAGYIFNHAIKIARTSGRNLYYTGATNPNGTPVYGRIDPTLLQKNIFTYDGNSNYHAGVLQLQRRMLQNFTLAAHYTWSKAIDDFTDFNSDFSPMDQLCKRCERALSPFHHSHRVVINAVYQSPAHNYLLAGWSLAPIFQANSGRPFNLLAGVDVNGDNYTTNDRPFPAGRDIGRGPSYVSFDLRLSRRFRLGQAEHRTLEFLAEGFNLANHTNFRTVNNTVGAVPLSAVPRPIAGIKGAAPTTPLAFTSAFDPRQFQFGLKLSF
ncbi:carboxypeptidase regulatory-like domain-containing protein [uncultured Paludibaculum sp.]|uniref:TonB-dependent receptor n=1 Tax=uncultured Paludibaculum sp. TaxID=1765020 RepID=UPI002AAB5F19|nr:carboxypeptidase regulatory-like domain-containing protein [uncultured Paludibaculum sp.]